MTWYEWLLAATVAVLFMLAALFIGVLLQALRDELGEAHRREREATDRLVMAWKDGAHIPPPSLPPAPPLEPLPAALRDELAVWEDPQHKMEMETHMRHELARGKSVAAILMDLDRDHG